MHVPFPERPRAGREQIVTLGAGLSPEYTLGHDLVRAHHVPWAGKGKTVSVLTRIRVNIGHVWYAWNRALLGGISPVQCNRYSLAIWKLISRLDIDFDPVSLHIVRR